MEIPSIHVGCGGFSLQRLEVLSREKLFKPVACVDINVAKAKKAIESSSHKSIHNLKNNIFTSITEAKKNMKQRHVLFLYQQKNMQN